ncbi:MAG TPA: right-handed parallel beta-helix repeat-containing protein [Lacunisphaera sp.]|nr:right-handed parallel beta-helix repeat-containing protein [Lacunisphaera sp.]
MNIPLPFPFRHLVAATLLAGIASAAPSGGPYGPLQVTYAVPAAGHVYYVAPDGKADASGATSAEPTTLEAAIEHVVTGDAIILRGGTYRTGDLVLNQGITLQPYGDERPVLKGTEVAGKWQSLRDGYWRTPWKKLFPSLPADWWRREREGMRTPLHRFNNDMVFIDGRPLSSAGWAGEVDANSFYIDYENGFVYLRTDPTGHEVEITAHDSALIRTTRPAHGKNPDTKGPVIRGLTFTQYAYRALEIEGKEPEGPQDPATFGKEVVGTTLENVAITHCSRVAGYFRGDHLTIRHCLVSDTSTEGIYIIDSADCLLENNIFRRNNVEKLTGYYPSAVKIFNQSYRVTCRDNLVIDNPDSNGIWYDVGNVDAVVVDNWFEDCQAGFFFEISKGATCAGNVFVNCEDGTRILNSSNVTVAQNTYLNSPATFERTERSAVNDHFGWHPATGPDVDHREGHAFLDNLLVGTADNARPLLRFIQPAALRERLTKPQVRELDGNVYVRQGDTRELLAWSPGTTSGLEQFASLDAFRQAEPAFDRHSVEFAGYRGAVFQSIELKRLAPAPGFKAAASGVPLPERVTGLLGRAAGAPAFAGAYPPAN